MIKSWKPPVITWIGISSRKRLPQRASRWRLITDATEAARVGGSGGGGIDTWTQAQSTLQGRLPGWGCRITERPKRLNDPRKHPWTRVGDDHKMTYCENWRLVSFTKLVLCNNKRMKTWALQLMIDRTPGVTSAFSLSRLFIPWNERPSPPQHERERESEGDTEGAERDSVYCLWEVNDGAA